MRGRNVAIALGLIVVASVAFYFLVWSPLDDQETALVEQTAALDAQAQQLRNQLAALQEIQANELQIRADLNRLRSLIPADEPAQPSFVRAVQLAADASGTQVQSLTFGLPQLVEGAPPPDAEGLVLTEISLNGVVEGGYFQIVDLFRRLEVEVVRAVQIDTVGLTEGSDGFPTLSAAITGRIFALLPVTAVEEPPATDADGDGVPDAPEDTDGDGTAEQEAGAATPEPVPGTTPAEEGTQ
jgi:Tfp pilus assembly protein PilO